MHKSSLRNKKKAYLFQNWFYIRILKVPWIASKAIISLENLGTEVSQVDCDMIPEGIQMARRSDHDTRRSRIVAIFIRLRVQVFFKKAIDLKNLFGHLKWLK